MIKKNIFLWVKKEIVFVIASLLAVATSFFTGVHTSHIDLNVIMLLFCLMGVVRVYKNENVLNKVSNFLLHRCETSKQLMWVLILLTFFGSMLITNDVALITFVPLSLIVVKKVNINPINIIVLLTLAANLGSSLTPIGNPQNLYLYSYYNLNLLQFIKIVLPLVTLSLLFILISVLKEPNEKIDIEVEEVKITNPKLISLYTFLLIIILLSVIHVIEVKWTFIITIFLMLVFNRQVLKEIDYSLLLTFLAFFIFIGNVSSVESITMVMQMLLNSKEQTYLTSIVASQFISNVPTAILLSTFTPYFEALIIGVNIGGLGSLIASLASVISYKLFVVEYHESSGIYLKKFTILNIIFLVSISSIFYLLI